MTACESLATFAGSGGEDQTIYEVRATDEAGQEVDEKLRAFRQLEVGVAVEYEISPYEHPRYGMSYTLKPPRKKPTGLQASVDAAKEKIDKLEKQVRWLYDRLLEKGLVPAPSAPAPAETDSRRESQDRTPEEPASAGADIPVGAGDPEHPF